MAQPIGVQPPKKRKIQTIFLGAFNGPSSSGTQSASTSTGVSNNSALTEAPSAFFVDSIRRQSVASHVPSANGHQHRTSPIRPNLSPICHMDQRIEHTMDEQRPNASTLKAQRVENDGERLLNHSSVSQLSVEGSSTSLNGSASLAATSSGEEQQLRPPLPELSLEGSAKLRSVPKMCHLQQNSAKSLELPVPSAQKELEFRLKLSSDTQIDRIFVQNSLSNKRTLKNALIVAKFGRETKWRHIVPSPVLLVQSNRNWTVVCLEDKTLMVLHSQTGRISFSVHTQSVLALLELRDHFCFAVSTQTAAQVWDLQQSRSLFHTSIRSLFGYSPEVPRIVHTFVSAKGLPVIGLSNGAVFLYSLSLQSWLSFQIDHAFVASKLSSLKSVAKTLSDGLIAALLQASNIEKAPIFVPPLRMEMAAAKEESELEMLLRMTRELGSWEEHRFLCAIYVQQLLSRGKRAKLVEFLAELRSLSQTHNELPFSTIAADLNPLLAKEEGFVDVEQLLNKAGTDTDTPTKRRERAMDGAATEWSLSNLLFKID